MPFKVQTTLNYTYVTQIVNENPHYLPSRKIPISISVQPNSQNTHQMFLLVPHVSRSYHCFKTFGIVFQNVKHLSTFKFCLALYDHRCNVRKKLMTPSGLRCFKVETFFIFSYSSYTHSYICVKKRRHKSKIVFCRMLRSYSSFWVGLKYLFLF